MRGKVVILVILLLAISASGFAWWWNYQRASRARAFWGEAAATIRFSTQVEALELIETSGAPTSESIRLGNQSFGIQCRIDLSQGRGLLNARTSLMVDEGFDWKAGRKDSSQERRWSHAVQFRHGSATVTLAFTDSGDEMAVVETGQVATLSAKTAAGWRSYLQRAFSSHQ